MKKRFFYVFDEHTDYVRECKKIGMMPIEKEVFVKNFDYDGIRYEVLNLYECFSGWEITVMATPELSYPELLNLMMNSRCYDEIVGSIGIVLKKYPNEFAMYLKSESSNQKRLLKIKKLIKKEIGVRNPDVKAMTELLKLC